VGRDLRGEVYLCASALVVEVYDDTGWVLDGVDEMSGDHFVQGGLVGDRCPALSERRTVDWLSRPSRDRPSRSSST